MGFKQSVWMNAYSLMWLEACTISWILVAYMTIKDEKDDMIKF